jgi:very-short-patch-repair endonuclease
MLWRYLAYAESRGADLGNAAKIKPELNPFERDIADKLGAAGIPLVPQFGCSGYWIDYAAQHPTRPGQMVLAIECDGATYHSSATARDRDRLRQQHLERLGWRFHRIWSHDWFYRHEAEISRAVAAYNAAVAASDGGDGGYKAPGAPLTGATPLPGDAAKSLHSGSGWEGTPYGSPESAPHGDGAPDPLTARAGRSGRCPVSVGRGTIGAYDHAELVAVIRWIESDTLLRTHDELLEETMRVLGFSRKGARITEAINGAIGSARDPSWTQPTLRPVAPVYRPPTRSSRRHPRRNRWGR